MEKAEYEYPPIEIGDVFTTDSNEEYRCVGYDDDGAPVCEPLIK